MKSTAKFLVGVDEAGRGPLAGPVAVGVVKVPKGFQWKLRLPEVDDSKKLSAEKRAELFRVAKELRHKGKLDFAVAMVGSSIIDEQGISYAVRLAMKRSIDRLDLHPAEVSIRLDGSLHAPTEYTQATVVGGDGLYPEIALASICAKETRDAYMRRADRRWPYYGFAAHKGYGTKEHRAQIAERGKCPIHRVSYCTNIVAKM